MRQKRQGEESDSEEDMVAKKGSSGRQIKKSIKTLNLSKRNKTGSTITKEK